MKDLSLKRDEINASIEAIYDYFERIIWFESTGNAELNSIKIKLTFTLNENRKYLIEIQSQITEYLLKYEQERELYKKIQILKSLKDQGQKEFYSRSNFEQIILEDESVCLGIKHRPKTKISLDFLYTDEGIGLLKKVAKKMKEHPRQKRDSAKSTEQEIQKEETKYIYDMDGLFEKFVKQEHYDLFTFILNFEFPAEIEVSIEKRISIYIRFSVEKHIKLKQEQVYEVFTFENEDLKTVSINFLKMYPNL